MMQRDYILRLIEQLAQTIAGLVVMRQNGQLQQAAQTVDEALQRLVGITLAEADALPTEQLLGVIRLTRGAQPPEVAAEQLVALAALLEQAAEIDVASGEAERGNARRLKALQIALTVALADDPGSPHAAALIEPSVDALAGYDLPPATKDQLWRYFEQAGRFARAEDWLFELLDDEPAPAGVVTRGVAFYERLAARSDAELRAGDLPREEVLAGLAELRERSD